MNKAIAGTFVAAACAVGLSAQTLPQTQPMQDAKDNAKNVTVTGCLKAGDGANTYLLSDLKWSDKVPAAVGTSGVVAPMAQAVTATVLNLVGSPSGTKLSDHVGHQVEVTGTMDKSDKDKATAATPPDAPARTQAALNVRSVKMIAAACQVR